MSVELPETEWKVVDIHYLPYTLSESIRQQTPKRGLIAISRISIQRELLCLQSTTTKYLMKFVKLNLPVTFNGHTSNLLTKGALNWDEQC